jgi:hypothetical protein
VAIQVITVTAMMIWKQDMGNDAINAVVPEELLTKVNVIAVSAMVKHGLSIVQDAHVTGIVFE